VPGKKYAEGDWFAVPLRSGGYAIGVVARASRGGVLLGYFFGHEQLRLPTLADVETLRPADAIHVQRFGHLGFQQGTWPVLGRLAAWDRSAWSMPTFVRYEELTGRSFRVLYDDEDPNRLVREIEVEPGQPEQGPRDAMAGAGAVEKILTSLLAT
jgi:hypothetical protein